jgi:hypothetical protein
MLNCGGYKGQVFYRCSRAFYDEGKAIKSTNFSFSNDRGGVELPCAEGRVPFPKTDYWRTWAVWATVLIRISWANRNRFVKRLGFTSRSRYVEICCSERAFVVAPPSFVPSFAPSRDDPARIRTDRAFRTDLQEWSGWPFGSTPIQTVPEIR